MKANWVFYGGVLFDKYTDAEFREARYSWMPEIYNGAYVYCPLLERHWYRLDGTPVLDEDVPVNLRTLVLILS